MEIEKRIDRLVYRERYKRTKQEREKKAQILKEATKQRTATMHQRIQLVPDNFKQYFVQVDCLKLSKKIGVQLYWVDRYINGYDDVKWKELIESKLKGV